jgi:hypothetical protein
MGGGGWMLMGRKRPLEDKAKISASMMGNSNGKIQTNSIKIEVTDLELKTKTTYNSISAATRALNFPQSSIPKYFSQGLRPQKKPYKKRYVFTKHS